MIVLDGSSLVTYSFQMMWNNTLASGHLTQLQDHSMQLGQLEQASKLTVHVSAKTAKHIFFFKDRQLKLDGIILYF